jgi:DNA gyrase subunit A
VNLLQLADGEKVTTIRAVKDLTEPVVDLVFVSRRGFVKRTPLAAYANVRAAGLGAVDLVDGDELLTVCTADRSADLYFETRKGRALRFLGSKLREMGRIARGVRGIRMRTEDDAVADLAILPAVGVTHMVTVTENGYGKRTPIEQYPVKGRGTKGVLDIATDSRNGLVVKAVGTENGDQLLIITDTGRVIRMLVADIREVGRRTRGVRLMRLGDGERVVAVERILESEAAEMGDAIAPAEAPPEPDAEEVVEVVDDGEDEADDGEADE